MLEAAVLAPPPDVAGAMPAGVAAGRIGQERRRRLVGAPPVAQRQVATANHELADRADGNRVPILVEQIGLGVRRPGYFVPNSRSPASPSPGTM
jgi:hypothetical protein